MNYNAGRGARFTEDNSYGPAFNSAGGGWYAIERTDEGIKIWFWSARNGNPPRDVYRGLPVVDTSDWVSRCGGRVKTVCGLLMFMFCDWQGTPSAYYPNTQCDLREKFGRHNIIINLTLCGLTVFPSRKGDEC